MVNDQQVGDEFKLWIVWCGDMPFVCVLIPYYRAY